MSHLEHCRQMMAAREYQAEMEKSDEGKVLERFWIWAPTAVVVWGVLAFCVVLLESRKWIF
jgi:hypothetical protein